MTEPIQPTRSDRPPSVSVREIAAVTARLRALSAPGANADPTERAAFLADKDALIERIMAESPGRDPLGWPDPREALERLAEPSRPDDPAEITARVADLTVRTQQADTTADRPDVDPIAGARQHDRPPDGGEQWLSPAEETVTRAEAIERLAAIGYDRDSAETMVTEYLHETSRAIGVSVYQWGLDQHDVDAIAGTYRWVDRYRSESLAEARERATLESTRWTDRVTDAGDDPAQAQRAEHTAKRWADRARVPEPFTPEFAEDTEEALASTAAVAQAHHMVAGLPTPREPAGESATWEQASDQNINSDEFGLAYGDPVIEGGDR